MRQSSRDLFQVSGHPCPITLSPRTQKSLGKQTNVQRSAQFPSWSNYVSQHRDFVLASRESASALVCLSVCQQALVCKILFQCSSGTGLQKQQLLYGLIHSCQNCSSWLLQVSICCGVLCHSSRSQFLQLEDCYVVLAISIFSVAFLQEIFPPTYPEIICQILNSSPAPFWILVFLTGRPQMVLVHP